MSKSEKWFIDQNFQRVSSTSKLDIQNFYLQVKVPIYEVQFEKEEFVQRCFIEKNYFQSWRFTKLDCDEFSRKQINSTNFDFFLSFFDRSYFDFTSLKSLNLRFVVSLNDWLSNFIDFLSKCPNLQELWIKLDEITGDIFEEISKTLSAIKRYNTKLQTFNLEREFGAEESKKKINALKRQYFWIQLKIS